MRDLKYLYNVANQLVGKLKVFDETQPPVRAEDVPHFFSGAVYAELQKWSSAKLGELATYGRELGGEEAASGKVPYRTSLYQVHNGGWLDKYASGRNLLLSIATTTVLAAMMDVVRNRRPQDDFIVNPPPHVKQSANGGWYTEAHRKPTRDGTPIPHSSRYQSR